MFAVVVFNLLFASESRELSVQSLAVCVGGRKEHADSANSKNSSPRASQNRTEKLFSNT